MLIKTLLLTAAVLAASSASAAPQLATTAAASANFMAPPVSDPVLAEIRGGQAANEVQFARNARAILSNQFDFNTRTVNGIAGEIVDTWWASTGLELISANVLGR